MGRKLVDGQQFPAALSDDGNFKVSIEEGAGLVVVTATVLVNSVEELPTPAASLRGNIALLKGGEGIADTLYVCVKLADDSYDWVNLSQYVSF